MDAHDPLHWTHGGNLLQRQLLDAGCTASLMEAVGKNAADSTCSAVEYWCAMVRHPVESACTSWAQEVQMPALLRQFRNFHPYSDVARLVEALHSGTDYHCQKGKGDSRADRENLLGVLVQLQCWDVPSIVLTARCWLSGQVTNYCKDQNQTGLYPVSKVRNDLLA